MSSNFRWFLDTYYSFTFKAEHENSCCFSNQIHTCTLVLERLYCVFAWATLLLHNGFATHSFVFPNMTYGSRNVVLMCMRMMY
jgi:hypothetical protein